MRVGTGPYLERRLGVRASVHTYRWGFHIKLRRGATWRHFIVKTRRGAVFGKERARGEIWVGWWSSRKGERAPLSGWRIKLHADRMAKIRPRESWSVPVYPTKARDRRSERRRNAA